MRTTITARHCEIPDVLRQRAVEQIEKLVRKAHRAQRAQVVFDAGPRRKLVELTLSLPRGQVHFASAEASDFDSALDRASQKLLHQLDKVGDRFSRRRLATRGKIAR